MKVLIIGLPYFAKHLAKMLKSYFPSDSFIPLNTYYSKADKIRYLFNLPTADIVHSINGTLEKSLAINLAIKTQKKLFFHWVGSDLVKAESIYKSGNYISKLIKYPHHLTDTPWFINRMDSIGIKGEFIPLKGFSEKTEIPPFPDQFSVLVYIGNSNPEFYGFSRIKNIARQLPDLVFNIVGIEAPNENLPANIRFHGWVSNMNSFIDKSVVTLRLPETDGLSFTVLESLAKGRYVAYNQPFEHSTLCKTDEDFVEFLKDLYEKFDNKLLNPAIDISEILQSKFNEKEISNQLMDKYLNAINQ